MNTIASQAGALALGGNVFGWTANRTESFAILDIFVREHQGRLIDTADSYTASAPGNIGGESETIIGQWLASRNVRDDVVVATKVGRHPDFIGLAPSNITQAVDASLLRLAIDVIDLYYAHFDDPDVDMVDIAGTFSSLVDSGKIREIGISNMSVPRILEWFDVAQEHGFHLPVALQPHYNLMEVEYEDNGLRTIADQHDLAVFPYYALAKGFLTGKYRSRDDAYGANVSPRAQGALDYLGPRGNAVLHVLDEISTVRETSHTAVSLAWLRQQPTVTAPIASARNREQLQSLGDSVQLQLTESELGRLRDATSLTT